MRDMFIFRQIKKVLKMTVGAVFAGSVGCAENETISEGNGIATNELKTAALLCEIQRYGRI